MSTVPTARMSIRRRAMLLLAASSLAVGGALTGLGAPAPADAAPAMKLPFSCGETWRTSTRANHSPSGNSVDFNRSKGDALGRAVLAPAAGTVTKVRTVSGSYGKWIEVSHGNGYSTLYAHLNSQSVKVGQKVTQGQKLGTVGSTGNSSGPHLHFEVKHNGTVVRPNFIEGSVKYYAASKDGYTLTSKNCPGNSGGGGDAKPPAGTSKGTVRTSGINLNKRSGPGTNHSVVGSLPNGSTVYIACHKRGTTVTGTYGTSNIWNKLSDGTWVPDPYVYTGSDGPVQEWC